MPSTSTLPIDAFPTWIRFNDVHFNNTKLAETEGKGLGLVAELDLRTLTANGEGDGDVGQSPNTLLRIPHDLVLSAETVKEYANVDQNFRQLLEVAGHQSTRNDILLYLLAQLISSHRNHVGSRGCASTPWTEYLKFLPRYVPVPTMWTEAERALLQGTSLEAALESKLAILAGQFDELREKSSGLTFWNSLLWEKGTATIQDWILVEAWYRSRCLELPRAGVAMVPALDMVNHSHRPTAYYEEDEQDGVVLFLRPGVEVMGGEEVTITYGEEKSAAEMLFSYGFIDPEHAVHKLVLPLDAMPGDPLGKAKLHIFKEAPVLQLSRTDGPLEWSSAFAYLMCLNEEDGLEFRVLQGTDGERQLKLFWQDEDVTGRARDFESLIEGHPLQQVFRLRVVVVLHELVSTQLTHLSSDFSLETLEPLCRTGKVREACVQEAVKLRDIERRVLESAVETLDRQKTHLLADGHVVAYLGSMEASESGQAPESPANEEDDFS